MPELVLHIHEIDEDGKDYSFALAPAWLDSVLADANLRCDPACGAGSLAVHAQKNGPEFLVHGQLKAGLLAQCGRCLADAKVSVSVPFASLFCRASNKAMPVSLELSEDDLQREEFSGHELVLDQLVREQLVLECPMQPLCSPLCQGIEVPKNVRPPADIFGTSDAPVDPRLAPLMRLRDKVRPSKV